MVLFQIDIQGITLLEPKSDSPRTVDGNSKSFRLAVQPVKMKAGQVHVFRLRRLIERIEQAQAFLVLIRTHLRARAVQKKVSQALVPP